MSSLIYYNSGEIPDVYRIGGKARSLSVMVGEGIRVPKFITLTVDFFESFMGSSMEELNSLLKKECTSKDEVDELVRNISELIEKKPFSAEHKGLVLSAINNYFGKTAGRYFSVRSSATDEDSAKHSFAGQLDSFLYIKLDEQLIKSIKNCFISAYSERAMSYRFINKLPFKSVRPAVIIQEMVFGEISGVLFTGNPLNNNPDQTLLNAVYGIGEGIVSGELDADSWVIDESGNIVKSSILPKKHKITFNASAGYGTKKVDVETQYVDKPSVSNKQVLQLYEIGRKIEHVFGGFPQDIEWCIKDNNIYILQSRPITIMSRINKRERKTVLDNSNIIESYPGVITPLTFSYSVRIYEMVYRRFYFLAGTSKKRIDELAATFRNKISYFNSRAYYNLNSWYEGMMLFPGYKYNKWFMENMMGVKATAKFEKERSPSFFKRLFSDYPRLLKGIFKVMYLYLFSDSIKNRFIKEFYETTGKYLNEKFEGYSNREILEKYLYVEKKTFGNWDSPIINDFTVMIFYGMLAKRIAALDIEDKAGLQNDLLCGQGDVESTKPTREIIRISNIIREDSYLYKLFSKNTEDELISIILNTKNERYDEIREILKQYISEYGFRCMNEMKLEEDTLKENPAFLFTMIKNYLRKPAIDLQDMSRKEREIRLKAEQMLFSRIKGRQKLWTRWILKNARRAIKNREQLRFMRTKVYGVFRSMFNAIGRNFERDGLIEHYKDIYFLHFNDIFELVEGRSIDTAIIKDIISARKKKLEEDNNTEPHERMYFYGDMYKRNFVEILSEDEVEYIDYGEDTKTLKGIPCSPGTIEGIAKIVLSPVDANLNGEILVAKRTDPGWVPLFPSVSGIVIERGSPLSHSAVVAREMGIPAIVGVRRVTEVIPDNERIRMNGSTGIIEKIAVE
ncbi:MAG: PEP-utilizing enzyme [Clostridia bacterium]|nr:PEP-utilizing enzyme [Clostridia bacterium]